MPTNKHHNADSSVRHTASAGNIDFLAYKEWKASMKRERLVEKKFLFFTWEGWERDGDPLFFEAEWQDGLGNLTTFPPIATSKTGYRSLKHLYFFAGTGPENEAVSSITSMRMTYTFNDEQFEIVAGKNWITYAIALIVLVVAIVLLASIGIL